jgi:hypothetical protein
MPSTESELNLKRQSFWNLAEAAVFVSNLQLAAFRAGFCLSLGGGVLNNGYSEHDLDLVAVARFPSSSNRALLDAMINCGLQYVDSRDKNPGRYYQFNYNMKKPVGILSVGGV